MANTIFYNRSIDLAMAEQSVSRVIRVKRNTREITIEAILEATCQQWDVSEEEVFSKSRKANIVTVRQTAMYLAQKLTKITTSKIGIHIGGRNHATVLHSIKQVNDRMSTDRSYEKTVNEIEKLLKKG
jgi:chromosomal replication initiator protein